MEWTDKDREALLSFKDTVDCDEIKVKEQIKKILLNNRFLVHVINNDELEKNDAEPDEYYGINILDRYMVPDIQTETLNYVCYEVGWDEINRYNSTVKVLQVTFYILCHQKDLKDKDTGIARHDLLSAIIQQEFNWTTRIGGGRLHLVSNKPSTTDTNYAARTLIYEMNTDSDLVKTRNGVPKIINKMVEPRA